MVLNVKIACPSPKVLTQHVGLFNLWVISFLPSQEELTLLWEKSKKGEAFDELNAKIADLDRRVKILESKLPTG